MLDDEGKRNIQKITNTATRIWGDRYEIEAIDVLEAPFCMFEMRIRILNRHDVKLSYDRSILDISVKISGEYVWLTDLTELAVVEGFESCKEENLIHNFTVINTVLHAT